MAGKTTNKTKSSDKTIIRNKKKNLFRILSIDGGGIRGIIPAMILDYIEKKTKKHISQLFDLISGTSTGGIIALGLVVPDNNRSPMYNAEDLVKLYKEKAKCIFPSRFFYNTLSIGGLFEEKYTSSGIEKVLYDFFGDAKLSNVIIDVIIPSYDIERRIAFFFKSQSAKKISTYDFLLWKVARAASAAPVYFEPFKLDSADPQEYFPLIDGGLVANNPAMCAYAEAKKIMGKTEKNIFLLSLGTGISFKSYKYLKAKRWGAISWAKPLLNIFFDGVSQSVDYQLQHILDDTYFRLQPELQSENDNLDNADPTNIKDLIIRTENFIRKNQKELDRICEIL